MFFACLCTQAFLANGAAIEARDSGGSTPLRWATANGATAAAEALLAAGADVNAADVIGYTPLDYALYYKANDMPVAQGGNHDDTIALLLAKGGKAVKQAHLLKK